MCHVTLLPLSFTFSSRAKKIIFMFTTCYLLRNISMSLSLNYSLNSKKNFPLVDFCSFCLPSDMLMFTSILKNVFSRLVMRIAGARMRYGVCANDVGKLMKNYHKYVLVYLGLVKVWPLDFNCMKFSRFHHTMFGWLENSNSWFVNSLWSILTEANQTKIMQSLSTSISVTLFLSSLHSFSSFTVM